MAGGLFKVLLFKNTMFLIPDIKMLECYVDTTLINMHKDSSEGHGHPPNVPDQAISSRLLPQNVSAAFILFNEKWLDGIAFWVGKYSTTPSEEI